MPDARYRLFCRASGVYYQQDTTTGTQVSLRTKDKHVAHEKLRAVNESLVQPQLNLDLARIYLRAHDDAIGQRTWAEVIKVYSERGRDTSRQRCERAFAGRDFDGLRERLLIHTKAEHLLAVLKTGKPSVNHYLRRLVHHAEDLGWLPWTIMAKAAWPRIKKGKKRGITTEEHQRIIEAEKNVERRAFYELLWLSGGSQGDIASLERENIQGDLLVYQRKKLVVDAPPSCLRMGAKMKALLSDLPTKGTLFPSLAKQKSNDRSAEFRRRCRLLGINGVSLHSYRYAWAGRAAKVGYPQRFAQAALGHGSTAVHTSYHNHQVVTVPPLEDYESDEKLIPFPPITKTPRRGKLAG